ncbi:MAG: hypothetical protein ACRDS1_00625 [Pseudonocardiaceae bacterium]
MLVPNSASSEHCAPSCREALQGLCRANAAGSRPKGTTGLAVLGRAWLAAKLFAIVRLDIAARPEELARTEFVGCRERYPLPEFLPAPSKLLICYSISPKNCMR